VWLTITSVNKVVLPENDLSKFYLIHINRNSQWPLVTNKLKRYWLMSLPKLWKRMKQGSKMVSDVHENLYIHRRSVLSRTDWENESVIQSWHEVLNWLPSKNELYWFTVETQGHSISSSVFPHFIQSHIKTTNLYGASNSKHSVRIYSKQQLLLPTNSM